MNKDNNNYFKEKFPKYRESEIKYSKNELDLIDIYENYDGEDKADVLLGQSIKVIDDFYKEVIPTEDMVNYLGGKLNEDYGIRRETNTIWITNIIPVVFEGEIFYCIGLNSARSIFPSDVTFEYKNHLIKFYLDLKEKDKI